MGIANLVFDAASPFNAEPRLTIRENNETFRSKALREESSERDVSGFG
jgi:hypothetical protein